MKYLEKFKTPVTDLITFIAIINTVRQYLLLKEYNYESWEYWNLLGYFSNTQIWDGAYWAYLTTQFVHADIAHLLFNLYWIWYFGSQLERGLKKYEFLLLLLIFSITSSGLEFLISVDTGIGISGIVYGMYGYLYINHRNNDYFKLPTRVSLIILGWLILSTILSMKEIYNVAIYAHFGGLVAGVLAAYVLPKNTNRIYFLVSKILLIFILLISIMPLFYNPISYEWHGYHAYKQDEKGNVHIALKHYTKAIELNPKDAWSYYNRAYSYEDLNRKELAKDDFVMACKLDPDYCD